MVTTIIFEVNICSVYVEHKRRSLPHVAYSSIQLTYIIRQQRVPVLLFDLAPQTTLKNGVPESLGQSQKRPHDERRTKAKGKRIVCTKKINSHHDIRHEAPRTPLTKISTTPPAAFYINTNPMKYQIRPAITGERLFRPTVTFAVLNGPEETTVLKRYGTVVFTVWQRHG